MNSEKPPEPEWKPGEAEPPENLERGPEIPDIEIPTFVKREQPTGPEAPKKAPEKPRGPSRIERLGEALRAGARGAKEGWQEKAAERKAAKEVTRGKAAKPTGVRFEFNLLGDAVQRIKERRGEESVGVKERLIQKLETFRGGIEKGLEKFRKEESPETRGEKRAELLKEWEKMTEDERREHYGRRFERAERLYAFEKVRVNFFELEKEYNSLSWLDRKVLGEEAKTIEEEYEAAKIEYERRRAEIVGANAWLMLNERMRVAEQEATRHEKGWFEKVRKGWRWLGEQNLEKLVSKLPILEVRPNKFAKIGSRMFSLRTAASLGLLGGSMALGFGSAAGLTALAARRVMGGLGAAFGSYDLMSQITEKRALAFNKDELAKMSQDELDAKMAEFEARAKFSGERIIHNNDYDVLIQEFVRRVNSEPVEQQTILDAIEHLDKALRERKVEVAKGEKHRKMAAVGIGLFSVGFFSAGSIAKLLEGKPEFAGVTPEAIRDTIARGPVVLPDTVQEAIQVEAAVPDTVLEQADTIQVEVPATEAAPEAAPGPGAVPEAPTEVVPEVTPSPEAAMPEAPAAAAEVAPTEVTPEVTPAEAAPAEAAAEAVTEVRAEAVGVVKKGGSAWQTTKELVDAGKITQEQFAQAWSNPASVIELESGRTIHISELGLTHEGDQVVYVPATETLRAHFEVLDYTEDVLHVGSNEDLAAAFEAAGKPQPEWLQQSVEAQLSEYPEVKLDLAGEARLGELMPVPQEIIEKAAAGGLEIKEEITGIEWGTVEFVSDTDGNVVDIVIRETMSPQERVRLSKLAADTFLLPGFETVIQEDAQKVVRAQEAAVKVLELSTALEHFILKLRAGDILESEFIRYKIKSIVRATEDMLGKQVFTSDKALRF